MELILAAAATALIISIIDYWVDIRFYRVPAAIATSLVTTYSLSIDTVYAQQLIVWSLASAFIALTSIQVLYSMTKVSSTSIKARR